MKLEGHEIQFIDRYLKDAGVKYLDIRYEMTDHVAAALEEKEDEFYENFRQYMVLHKKELLESNRKFTQLAGKRALRMLLTAMYHPISIIVFIIFFTASVQLDRLMLTAQVMEIFNAGYMIISLLVIWFVKFSLGDIKQNYSVADKLLTALVGVLYVLFVFIRPDRIIENSMYLFGFYSFLAAFLAANIISYRKLVKKYRTQFNG